MRLGGVLLLSSLAFLVAGCGTPRSELLGTSRDSAESMEDVSYMLQFVAYDDDENGVADTCETAANRRARRWGRIVETSGVTTSIVVCPRPARIANVMSVYVYAPFDSTQIQIVIHKVEGGSALRLRPRRVAHGVLGFGWMPTHAFLGDVIVRIETPVDTVEASVEVLP